MSAIRPVADALALYKTRPARILTVGDKLEIELPTGAVKRVRPKDVTVLHPGPVKSLSELSAPQGELTEAWELLDGAATNLRELTELIYGDFSPATAWAAWEQVADGLYFEGVPEEIRVNPSEYVEKKIAERAEKNAAKRAWESFAGRVAEGRVLPEDDERMTEVARLALGESQYSRILKDLGYKESQESAHRFLVQLGYWRESDNPHPARLGVPTTTPDLSVPPLPDEERSDLTNLPAYAIDDVLSQDPDDAVSMDGDRIWVHIADVAALVPPGSDLDLAARSRGSNLYLPDRTAPMLPFGVTACLGLGLQELSPALSIGFTLSAEGHPQETEIRPSLVRVRRVSYEDVHERLREQPFDRLLEVARRYRSRRMAAGSVSIDLPEVSVRVFDGRVVVKPLPRTQSRDLVTEAMLMAGEAAAVFCSERELPVPYVTQSAPEATVPPDGMAAMYAYRNQLKPSRLSLEAAAHDGLGLERYLRVTSPLRRYSDLIVHQQIRAHLRGDTPLAKNDLEIPIAAADSASSVVRKAERLSNLHWKLVFLNQNPDWRGTGILVQKDGNKGVVIVVELGMEARVRLRGNPALGSEFQVIPREVDLPGLTCYFNLRD